MEGGRKAAEEAAAVRAIENVSGSALVKGRLGPFSTSTPTFD